MFNDIEDDDEFGEKKKKNIRKGKRKLVQSDLFSSKIPSSNGMFEVLGYTRKDKMSKNIGLIINAPPKVTNIYHGQVLGAGVSNINFGNLDNSEHHSDSFNKTIIHAMNNPIGDNESNKKRRLLVSKIPFKEKEKHQLLNDWRKLITEKGLSANLAVEELNKERIKNNERSVSRDTLFTWQKEIKDGVKKVDGRLANVDFEKEVLNKLIFRAMETFVKEGLHNNENLSEIKKRIFNISYTYDFIKKAALDTQKEEKWFENETVQGLMFSKHWCFNVIKRNHLVNHQITSEMKDKVLASFNDNQSQISEIVRELLLA